jgi:hypothetical protein
MKAEGGRMKDEAPAPAGMTSAAPVATFSLTILPAFPFSLHPSTFLLSPHGPPR